MVENKVQLSWEIRTNLKTSKTRIAAKLKFANSSAI